MTQEIIKDIELRIEALLVELDNYTRFAEECEFLSKLEPEYLSNLSYVDTIKYYNDKMKECNIKIQDEMSKMNYIKSRK